MTASDLSPAQIEAWRIYGRAYVNARREDSATARVYGGEALRKVRAVLAPPEAAILDMVAGRGYTLNDLSERLGRDLDGLRALYRGALNKVVAHLEGR